MPQRKLELAQHCTVIQDFDLNTMQAAEPARLAYIDLAQQYNPLVLLFMYVRVVDNAHKL